MSKEYLDAFKNLKQELYYSPNQIPDIDKWHEIVERALQRLNDIDNSNPSEALKCLEGIENALWDDDFHYQRHSKLLDTIEQALLKAQEQELNNGGRLLNKDLLYLSQCLKQCNDLPLLYVNRTYGNKYVVPQKQFDDLTNENELLKKKARALEIIKEKNVDIALVKAVDSVEQYNHIYVCEHMLDAKWGLTEEEFDLLKEVVE